MIALTQRLARWGFTPACVTPDGSSFPWVVEALGFTLRGEWGFDLSVSYDEEVHGFSLTLHLGYPLLRVRLPIPRRFWPRQRDCMIDLWGVQASDDALLCHWRDRTKVWVLPFTRQYYATRRLCRDGTWVTQRRGQRQDLDETQLWVGSYPFTYTLENGETQDRTLTCRVTEQLTRRRWLRWCPWGQTRERYLDFEFDRPVGDGIVSWQGGVIGSTERMRLGESAAQCVRRIERERRFD